jgi:hypothetical protein
MGVGQAGWPEEFVELYGQVLVGTATLKVEHRTDQSAAGTRPLDHDNRTCHSSIIGCHIPGGYPPDRIRRRTDVSAPMKSHRCNSHRCFRANAVDTVPQIVSTPRFDIAVTG